MTARGFLKRVGRKICGAYALVTFRDAMHNRLRVEASARCCWQARAMTPLPRALQVFFEQARTAHTMLVTVPDGTEVCVRVCICLCLCVFLSLFLCVCL